MSNNTITSTTTIIYAHNKTSESHTVESRSGSLFAVLELENFLDSSSEFAARRPVYDPVERHVGASDRQTNIDDGLCICLRVTYALQEPPNHHREPEDHIETKYQGGRANCLQFARRSSCRWHTGSSSRQSRCHAYLVGLFNGSFEYFTIYQYQENHPNDVCPVIEQTLYDKGVRGRTRCEINSGEIDGIDETNEEPKTPGYDKRHLCPSLCYECCVVEWIDYCNKTVDCDAYHDGVTGKIGDLEKSE